MPRVAKHLRTIHFSSATLGGTLVSMAITDKETQMTISLGTVSEMTKGFDAPQLLDNPMAKPGAFARYTSQF